MAAPVLTVTRTPAGVVTPGTQVTFTVTATDADARTITYTFVGTDTNSGTPTEVTETVTVSDPVTVEGSVSDPADVATLSQGSGNLWHSTV
jgi:hypothetical protein